jgi:hypothetical protein
MTCPGGPSAASREYERYREMIGPQRRVQLEMCSVDFNRQY